MACTRAELPSSYAATASTVCWSTTLILSWMLLASGVLAVTATNKPDACTSTGITALCVCNIVGKYGNVRCIEKNTGGVVPGNIPTRTAILVIQQSGIKQIQKDDFVGLEGLTTLFLQKNEIATIHPDAFRNLYKLETLNIEENLLTKLDLSGKTFQHLASLKSLFLDNSDIARLNKFSFFTLAGAQQSLTVSMRGNPVECDCNVKALRKWQDSLPMSTITFKDLKCTNARNNMAYNDPNLDASIFGQCTVSGDLFQYSAYCHDCDRDTSNYACRQRNIIRCQGADMVCQESVTWDMTNKKMSITSGCAPYQTCLVNAHGNSESCGIDPNRNVDCTFCCLGPTCQNNTIGGRTVDYTYEIRYIRRLSYTPDLGDPQSGSYSASETTIRNGITLILNGIDGGITVVLDRFEPEMDNTHKVVVKVQVTALNLTPSKTIFKQIESKLNASSKLSKGFFQDQMYKYDSPIDLSSATPVDSAPDLNVECKNETTTNTKGRFVWPTTVPNRTTNILCPNIDLTTRGIQVATRKCLPNGTWAGVDDSRCDETVTTTPPPTIGSLEKASITADNVFAISSQLLESIMKEKPFTAKKINLAVNILEKMATEEFLAKDGVPSNVVSSISGLMDVDSETIRKAQLETSTSQRLLHIIDDVAEKSPLTEGQLVIKAPNIAIAAQGVTRQETRTAVLTTEDRSSGNVEIDLQLKSSGYIPSSRETSFSIPIKAVSSSLPPNQRNKLKRVTFAVHKEDKLFYVSPQENVPQQVDDNQFFYKSDVNSQIIAASVPGVTVKNLKENITMNFIHDSTNSTNPQCVSWRQSLAGGEGNWTTDGCGVVGTSDTNTICGCTHLTNFALLMDVYQEGGSLSDLDKKVLSIISYIGCGISLLALLLTLLTYGCFRKLRRDNPSKILINLCLALFFTNLVFLVGMQDYVFDMNISCKIVTVLLHYFLLASLTWMAVEAFYMYLALVLVFKTYFTRFIFKCCLVGWGIPLAIIITTLAIDSTDNYGFINNGLCWLKNPAFYIAFLAPVCIILLINVAAFILVIRQLINMSDGSITKTDRSSTIQRLRGAIGVVILLGLSWVFAIFAIDSASVVFYYLFAVFNSLQGLFIFLFYCLFKKDTLSSWKRKLLCFDEYGDQSKTSANSKEKAKEPSKGTASTSANTQHGVKIKPNSGSSSNTNTMSTACTVASNSRSSSNVYNSIDDLETERLNIEGEPRPGSKPNEFPPSTNTTTDHLLSGKGEYQNASPELYYSNVASKYQMRNDASPQPIVTDLPSPNVQYSGKDNNISIISQAKPHDTQKRQQHPQSINPADTSVNKDSNRGLRVRDLRHHFESKGLTSNKPDNDIQITRI